MPTPPQSFLPSLVVEGSNVGCAGRAAACLGGISATSPSFLPDSSPAAMTPLVESSTPKSFVRPTTDGRGPPHPARTPFTPDTGTKILVRGLAAAAAARAARAAPAAPAGPPWFHPTLMPPGRPTTDWRAPLSARNPFAPNTGVKILARGLTLARGLAAATSSPAAPVGPPRFHRRRGLAASAAARASLCLRAARRVNLGPYRATMHRRLAAVCMVTAETVFLFQSASSSRRRVSAMRQAIPRQRA